MTTRRQHLVYFLFALLISDEVFGASVTYRVLSKGPNGTKAEIDIKDNALYWTLVLRYDSPVKLRVVTGGRLVSSTSEGRIYMVAGVPTGPGQSRAVVFEAKYDKKTNSKLISATYNGRPVRLS